MISNNIKALLGSILMLGLIGNSSLVYGGNGGQSTGGQKGANASNSPEKTSVVGISNTDAQKSNDAKKDVSTVENTDEGMIMRGAITEKGMSSDVQEEDHATIIKSSSTGNNPKSQESTPKQNEIKK